MKTYTESEIVNELITLNEWNFKKGKLVKHFQFKNFNEALAFIVQVGIISEKQNHHPEIWNVYNKVIFKINTHDANGITEKDFKLANSIDEL